MHSSGMLLLQDVAQRILARYLERQGRTDVGIVSSFRSLGGRGIDITYPWQGAQHRIKVKADPYFGVDAAKVRDRSLAFYREDSGCFAFEAVANTATREPGWVVDSEADELYYYFLVLGQDEHEVAALMSEKDEVFFSEIAVDREALFVLPMSETRAWFSANSDEYPPRPVLLGNATAWYRLVPRDVIVRGVPGLRSVGPIFSGLAD